MSALKKVTVNNKDHGDEIVAEKVSSHANDPFVLKKVAKARAIVSKIKFPEYSTK